MAIARRAPGRAPTADLPLSLGESRARVLALVQDAGKPLGVADVAARTNLHPNTARFHLDGLVDAGLLERATAEGGQPGRPRALYTAVPGGERAGQRSYKLLAEILTGYLAAQGPRPAHAARQAGFAWGTKLAHRFASPRRGGTPSDSAATGQLVQMLDSVGFAPELKNTTNKQRIMLHHCPFREAAEEHREVVCSVHLGLMQGMLAEIEAPIEAWRLDPFVEPALCVAHLARRSAAE